jgi:fumarate hydratase subunit beta
MKDIVLSCADIRAAAPELRAGQRVLLSGTVYTARDAAHKKLTAILSAGGKLPFEPKDAVLYYAGPTQAPEGLPIGSCGPTTSARMDPFTPALLDAGVAAMIGKGERSKEVLEAIVRDRAVYFCALGGAGALACRCIKSCRVIAFPELGCESVKELTIEDFPLFVAADCGGWDIFSSGRGLWSRELAKA